MGVRREGLRLPLVSTYAYATAYTYASAVASTPTFTFTSTSTFCLYLCLFICLWPCFCLYRHLYFCLFTFASTSTSAPASAPALTFDCGAVWRPGFFEPANSSKTKRTRTNEKTNRITTRWRDCNARSPDCQIGRLTDCQVTRLPGQTAVPPE